MSTARAHAFWLWLAVAALAADAGAVLCRTKSGELVARDACRAKETAVVLADFGLQGAQGTPGAAGAPGRAAGYLVDSLGAEVGPLVYAGPVPEITVGSPQLFALVSRDELGGAALLAAGSEGETLGEVLYASADCTGSPLVDAATFMPVLQVIGGVVFRPGTAGAPVSVASREIDDPSQGCSRHAT